MLGPLEWYLNWAETIAYEDATAAGFAATKPDPNAPITLDRLWELCKKFLWGSSFLYKPTNGNTTIIYIDNRNSDDDAAATLAMLLIILWVCSGIAFQRGLQAGIKFFTNICQKLVSVPMGILGYVAGGLIAAVPGIFFKLFYGRPYSAYVKTGAEIGYDITTWAGNWIGWVAGLISGTVVGGTAGFVSGLPIGALTLVVAPLQFIKTTYNYISNKFQDVMHRDNGPAPQQIEVAHNIENIVIVQDLAANNAANAPLLEKQNYLSFGNANVSPLLLPITGSNDVSEDVSLNLASPGHRI